MNAMTDLRNHGLTRALANQARALTLAEIPEVTRAWARQCILDYTACGIAGAIYANQMLRAMVHACQSMAGKMISAGSLADLDSGLVKVSDINKLVNVQAGWSESDATPTSASSGSNGKTPHAAIDKAPRLNQRVKKSPKQVAAEV